MGYDVKVIEIEEIETVNGIRYKIIEKRELSMTFNFSCFKKDWYLPNEMNGQNGMAVASSITNVLNKYLEQGYEIGIPDPDNKNWTYGILNDENASDYEKTVHKKSVFMWILNNFLKVAKEYPNAYFINDYTSISTITLPDGSEHELKYFENELSAKC
jgi:hypothetical protein